MWYTVMYIGSDAGRLARVTHPDALPSPSVLGVTWAQDCLHPLPCPCLFSTCLCASAQAAFLSQPRLAGGIICFIQSERYLKPPVPFKVPNDGITPTWVLKLCQRGFLGIIIP